VSRHLHLPFQSGSDRVLEAMNRGYTRQEYLDIVAYARAKIPGLSLSSDVIVGFPGESYEEFSQTVSLIKEAEFSTLFTFIYSRRTGTKAAEMDDSVPEQEKTKWFMELLDAQEQITLKKAEEAKGSIQTVLVEGYSEEGLLQGRTPQNILTVFDGDKGFIGQFIQVKITGGSIYKLTAETNKEKE